MKSRMKLAAAATASLALLGACAVDQMSAPKSASVGNEVIAAQRAALAAATASDGTGPQAPRDISSNAGTNPVIFTSAPPYTSMNLCNIHFHENAEHKGGEFTTYAGNGNGKGAGTGFKYNGTLTAAELAPVGTTIGAGKYGDLAPGDTIEVHYVHSSAPIKPGPTLGACLSDEVSDPFLRVETQVMVLVNDPSANSFVELAKIETINGLYQAPNIPADAGTPVQYAGSTTGPSYNEKGSPLKVTWNVRPKVIKVDIQTVGAWLAGNVFEENAAHGVRNLVVNQALLSRF